MEKLGRKLTAKSATDLLKRLRQLTVLSKVFVSSNENYFLK
jgi:hypothetical protein